jgi:hypothetical protein
MFYTKKILPVPGPSAGGRQAGFPAMRSARSSAGVWRALRALRGLIPELGSPEKLEQIFLQHFMGLESAF